MSDLQPNLNEENPFLKFKARSLIFWFFLTQIIIGFCFGVIAGLLELDISSPTITNIVYCLSFCWLSFWMWQRFYKLQINPTLIVGNMPTKYRWLSLIGLVILLLFFALGSALLSFYLLSLFAPSFFKSLVEILATKSSNTPSIFGTSIQIIAYIIVAPITEEFIFRGFLLHRWAAKWGINRAILFSSLVFGFLHVNPLGLSVFGVVMALLYIKTHTLFVPTITHALYNTTVILMQLSADSSSSIEANSYSKNLPFGLFFLAVSTPFLILFIYKQWIKKNLQLPYFINAVK